MLHWLYSCLLHFVLGTVVSLLARLDGGVNTQSVKVEMRVVGWLWDAVTWREKSSSNSVYSLRGRILQFYTWQEQNSVAFWSVWPKTWRRRYISGNAQGGKGEWFLPHNPASKILFPFFADYDIIQFCQFLRLSNHRFSRKRDHIYLGHGCAINRRRSSSRDTIVVIFDVTDSCRLALVLNFI